jgi:hypothetical protein
VTRRREEHEIEELLEQILARETVALMRFLERIADNTDALVALLSPTATTAQLTLEGAPMPLDVGATQTATLTYVDATGAAAPAPKGDGSGLVVTITSDNTAVASVGPVSGDTAWVTGVSAGSFNLIANVANSSGAALNDDDGLTPFVQPAALADTVVAPPPAQATTGVLSVA